MEGGKPSTQRHSSGAVRPIVLVVVAVSLVAVLFMATRVSPGCRPLLKAVYQQGLGRAGPSVTADPLLGGLLSPDLDDGQDTLRGVRWLVLRSDNYFVPGLFFLPRYEEELVRLFPRRDTVFHHLGRYLFHPSNTVWAMATRYYSSYLAPAEERVGVQVREFKYARISADERYNQIISCVSRESLLPAVATLPSSESDHHQSQEQTKRKAVLVVSLNGDYYDKLSRLYYEHGAAGGGAVTVSVFQPTHLGMQHSEKRQHNQKAFAEIVLLSFSDVVVTSVQSTFGYVSQGLAGLRPWVLMLPVDGKVPDPPCRLASTIEPCFMKAPHYDCRTRGDSDNGKVVPYIRHCEDVSHGVQLVE